jgi:hypothetical protein
MIHTPFWQVNDGPGGSVTQPLARPAPPPPPFDGGAAGSVPVAAAVAVTAPPGAATVTVTGASRPPRGVRGVASGIGRTSTIGEGGLNSAAR